MLKELGDKNKEAVNPANYQELYHAAFKHLTFLHDNIEKAQRDLEAMYLKQTESATPSLSPVEN